jgi:hypothetical protein
MEYNGMLGNNRFFFDLCSIYVYAGEEKEELIFNNFLFNQGLHCNPYFPIFNGVDKSEKYQFKDHFRFNGSSNRSDSFNNKDRIRTVRKAIKSDIHGSSQVHQALNYQL